MKQARPAPIRIEVHRDRCGICGCCVPVCPPDAITLLAAVLTINNDTCTDCLKCIPVCPTNALYAVPEAVILSGDGQR